MARRKQSSSGFNFGNFEGVDFAVDLASEIERWRDQFVATVGMGDHARDMAKYRRAAGWAVDEVAKTAVQGIRLRFYNKLKRRSPWTESAVAYKRLSKSELSALERGERNAEAPGAQRGNPRGIRAKATDHAVRRFAERAIGVVVDEAVDDTAAIVELAHRGVNFRRVRKTLGELGGLGVADGAQAVVVNGLKLVIRGGAVVTVLAKTQMREPSAEPADTPRRPCVLDMGYRPRRTLPSSWHAYRNGEAAQVGVTAAWQAKAVAAEALANENADAASRLHRAEARLSAEVDKHSRDNLAADARYAEALDAARRAAESAKGARVACLPAGKGEGPPGSAPMTRSMRDALGVLRKGEHQVNRMFALVALAAGLFHGACATRVENTATVAPSMALTVGAAAAPVAPPPATIVKQEVLVTPQVPMAWRKCPDVPPVLADAATQDELTVWTLDTRYVAQACKANLGSIDSLLTKAEADAKCRGK